MGDLGRLAERIEAGEDNDTLSSEVIVALNGGKWIADPIDYHAVGRAVHTLHANGQELRSIDAALALKEQVLPGRTVELVIAPAETGARIMGENEEDAIGIASTPARAIVAAVLRAVEGRGEGCPLPEPPEESENDRV